MDEAGFDDSTRIELLTALKEVLNCPISSTSWACLWLSDIDKLTEVVDRARTGPVFMQLTLESVDNRKIVQQWTQRYRQSSHLQQPSSPSPLQQYTTASPPSPSPLQQQTTTSPPSPSPLQQEAITSSPSPSPLRQEVIIQSTPSPGSRKGKRKLDSDEQSGSSTPRSSKQRELCRRRDNSECVLTGDGFPHVAHIYPYSMLSASRTSPSQIRFWQILELFWSSNRIQKWQDAIFSDSTNPNKGVETCYNLICLSVSAHLYWTNAFFALKPIRLSDDKKRFDVEFHWLRQHRRSEVDILTDPRTSQDLESVPKAKLYHFPTDKPIRSGDMISLTTDDPVTQPLPHPTLLEMQWILHRLAAMSGAAEIYDNFDNFDNDNDDISVTFKDEWDLSGEDEWDSFGKPDKPPRDANNQL